MDKIIIKDLMVRGIIGINSWEREQGQAILINIEIFGDFRKAGETDDIQECINYHSIAEEVSTLVQQAKRFTIEALAADIAKVCLGKSGVAKVRVRVDKPHALWTAKSAGVEIVRTHQDFKSNL